MLFRLFPGNEHPNSQHAINNASVLIPVVQIVKDICLVVPHMRDAQTEMEKNAARISHENCLQYIYSTNLLNGLLVFCIHVHVFSRCQ